MTPHRLPQEVEDLVYCGEHDLLEANPVGRAVEKIVRFGIPDEFARDWLRRRVSRHRIDTAICPVPPFRKPRLIRGDFLHGFDSDGDPIWCPLQQRTQHQFVCTATGGGKSNLSRLEAIQLANLNVPGIWLISCQKREFSSLTPHFSRVGRKLNVVRARDMKLNPIEPPNQIDTLAYASNLCDALTRVLMLPPASERVLFQTLIQLYRDSGLLAGCRTRIPVMIEWREAVAASSHAHAQSRDAIISRFDSLIMSLGKALNYRKGWSVSEMDRLCVCFEFDDVSNSDADFLLNATLLQTFMLRVRTMSNAPLSLAIVMDEAGRVIGSADSAVSAMVGLVRGCGVSFSTSHQSAEISNQVMTNSVAKALGLVSSPADLQALGDSMGLSRDQRQFVRHHLRPGEFVMVSASADWRYPFLVRVPLVKIPSTASGSVDAPELDALPVIRAAEYDDWIPDWMRSTVAVPTDPFDLAFPNLSEDEARLLRVVLERSEPLPAAEVSGLLHIGTRKAGEIRKSLVAGGLIAEERIQLHARGRPSILLVATAEARHRLQGIE